LIRFVIGLGNPDAKYAATPHNLGRVLVEKAAEARKLKFREGSSFVSTEGEPSFVLSKTYMNESGKAVSDLLTKEGATPQEILVCYDDFDLPVGTLRIRKKGSGGTHNGMKSIVERLTSEDFPRLRIGVGPVPPGEDAAAFVLKPIPKSQWEAHKNALDRALEAMESIFIEGLEKAMNKFNAG